MPLAPRNAERNPSVRRPRGRQVAAHEGRNPAGLEALVAEEVPKLFERCMELVEGGARIHPTIC